MPKGKPYPAELKARVALEVIRGDRTVNEIASDHGKGLRTFLWTNLGG